MRRTQRRQRLTLRASQIGERDESFGTTHYAVAAPRIHHQWLPDVVQFETGSLPTLTVLALERMRHRTRDGLFVGAANSIFVDGQTGMRYGVADRRHPDARASPRDEA